MKKGGMITFHKSQNSGGTQDHEIAIPDGDLKYNASSTRYLKSWFPCLSKKKIFKSQSYTYTYLLISFPRKEENRNRNDFTALKETYRNLHYQHHAPPFDGM